MQELLRHADERVEAATSRLIALSQRIHGSPELAFEEHQASTWVAEALTDVGFAVESGLCDLPTAVRGRLGSGPLHVAVCAEYDALPEIGHGCGHNVIAASAVGVAHALAALVDDLDLTLTILGTPAEESGGGKALLLERGAFDGVDAAMMVHPAPLDIAALPSAAISTFDIRYRGRSSHAGASPEAGINAADAMTLAQVAVGLLRQQCRDGQRISGVVRQAGHAPNVIPDVSTATWTVRADGVEDLHSLKERVQRCFEAGAVGTGCDIEVVTSWPDYEDFSHNSTLLALCRASASRVGRPLLDLPVGSVRGGATDMGNVSRRIPSIHPMIGLNCSAMPHEAEFTAASASPAADAAVLFGARLLAGTIVELAISRPDLTGTPA